VRRIQKRLEKKDAKEGTFRGILEKTGESMRRKQRGKAYLPSSSASASSGIVDEESQYSKSLNKRHGFEILNSNSEF
jgi:hypothetical protein